MSAANSLILLVAEDAYVCLYIAGPTSVCIASIAHSFRSCSPVLV